MAVTIPTATPKPTALSTPSSDHSGFILSEALSVLSFLTARNLLCSTCGYGWAVADNAAYSHCTDCKRPNMTYNPRIGKGSDFERLLCKRLREWVSAFLKADKAAPADATDSSGK